jgi:2-polyprenyl-3-methyl-5-hydroxy-6-metoxy-1,4-benzoquinol methylase
MTDQRAEHEIKFGAHLSEKDTEHLWGWGTPAGKSRAQRRAQMIIEGAGLKPGMHALEVGCGTGMFTEIFAATGARILAVDISPDLLLKAERRGLPADRVTFLAKRFEDLDPQTTFDAIVGSSVLHHLDIKKSLETMRALLKPGGVIVFAEPNMLNPQVFLERKFRFLKMFSYVSPDETAFVRWSLRSLLAEMGFTDIKVEPFDWLHPAIPQSCIGVVSGIGRFLEKTPIIRESAGSLYISARLGPTGRN